MQSSLFSGSVPGGGCETTELSDSAASISVTPGALGDTSLGVEEEEEEEETVKKRWVQLRSHSSRGWEQAGGQHFSLPLDTLAW